MEAGAAIKEVIDRCMNWRIDAGGIIGILLVGI